MVGLPIYAVSPRFELSQLRIHGRLQVFREAVALKGDLDGAIAEHREALQMRPNFPGP